MAAALTAFETAKPHPDRVRPAVTAHLEPSGHKLRFSTPRIESTRTTCRAAPIELLGHLRPRPPAIIQVQPSKSVHRHRIKRRDHPKPAKNTALSMPARSADLDVQPPRVYPELEATTAISTTIAAAVSATVTAICTTAAAIAAGPTKEVLDRARPSHFSTATEKNPGISGKLKVSTEKRSAYKGSKSPFC